MGLELVKHRALLVLSSQVLALTLVQLLDGGLAIQTVDPSSSSIWYPLALSVQLCFSLQPLLRSLHHCSLVILVTVACHFV